MKSKYPKWFSIHQKPRRPQKPPEKILSDSIISSEIYADCSTISKAELLGAVRIYLEIEEDAKWRPYGQRSSGIRVVLYREPEEIDNPDYTHQMKRYEKDLAEYKQRSKEWKKYKAIYDQELVEKDRALYEKLKAKFS